MAKAKAKDKPIDLEEAERKAAAIADMKEKIAQGQDIVALAAGAGPLITTEDALNNHDIARLFAVPKNKGGRPTKYEPEWMNEAVIEVGRLGGSKEKMALKCRISKETLYAWCNEHKEFSDAVEEGNMLAQVWWENFGQVATLGMVEGWSAASWQFFMRTRFGDTYREVKVTEINNTGGPLIDARSIVINARELDENTQNKFRAALAALRQIQGAVDD